MGVQELNIQKGYGFYSNQNYSTNFHAHYAIEIIYCPTGYFEIQTQNNQYRIQAVIIPSNLPHRFICFEACNLLFADPVSAIGDYIIRKYRIFSRKDVFPNPPDIHCFFEKNKLESFYPAQANEITILDHRLEKCLTEIHKKITYSSLSVEKLSKIACLSESRLAHLFKEQMGVSIRQYVLWNKVRQAVIFSQKQNLTRSAHLAGFHDSSHFNRTFSKMFGVTPSFGLKI